MASDVLLAADGHWPRLLAELAGLTPEQLPKERIPLLLHKMMVRAACDALPLHCHCIATAYSIASA